MKIPLVCALVGTLGGAVWAQAPVAPGTMALAPTQPESQTYSIPVRNVKASLMAYWLDPANHEIPTKLGQAPATTRSMPRDKGLFQLPSGVGRIVAVDPQNTLLVFGTPESANLLRATVAFLDRPLRQVEIEAQFVQVNTSDLGAFGLGTKDESNTQQPNQRVGFVRGNFSAMLGDLVAAGKAKIITAPRVTAINNLTASLSQSSRIPVEIGVRDATGTLRPLENSNSLEGGPLFVSTRFKLEVTPTINNDDTITVLMDSGVERRLVTSEAASAPDFPKDSFLKTVVNVRDGETIALGSATATPALTKTTLVMLVTARIVRRVGENK